MYLCKRIGRNEYISIFKIIHFQSMYRFVSKLNYQVLKRKKKQLRKNKYNSQHTQQWKISMCTIVIQTAEYFTKNPK